MKLMAIDYGAKRVGIASTDDTGHFALPRKVLPNDDSLIENVLKFKNEENIEKVIIGESKNLDGSSNLIQTDIDKFREALKVLGVDTITHPEMFTTVEARRLQGNTEMTDASAAALLLKSFLDTMYNKSA